MIEITYPAPPKEGTIFHLPYRKPHFTPQEYQGAKTKGISVEEWRRRDKIIRLQAESFHSKITDVVFPKNKEDYIKYGGFIIRGICSSYKDMANEDWPEDDEPMILHLRTIMEPPIMMAATTNWVINKNIHV